MNKKDTNAMPTNPKEDETSSADNSSPISPAPSSFGGLKPLTAAQIVTLLLNSEPTMAACVY